ncbi:MAG: hypothetical protein U1F40_09510 [Turneriella sp.]
MQTVSYDGSGNWSGDITLSAGVNSIVATARDAANNTSCADSAALSITVDTTAPAGWVHQTLRRLPDPVLHRPTTSRMIPDL